jgi:hypothetical protein
MFFGSTPDSAPKDEGTSLSSVLPIPTLRVELALVLRLCIDSMRNDPTQELYAVHVGHALSLAFGLDYTATSTRAFQHVRERCASL